MPEREWDAELGCFIEIDPPVMPADEDWPVSIFDVLDIQDIYPY